MMLLLKSREVMLPHRPLSEASQDNFKKASWESSIGEMSVENKRAYGCTWRLQKIDIVPTELQSVKVRQMPLNALYLDTNQRILGAKRCPDTDLSPRNASLVQDEHLQRGESRRFQ